jgi:hypothetical protein
MRMPVLSSCPLPICIIFFSIISSTGEYFDPEEYNLVKEAAQVLLEEDASSPDAPSGGARASARATESERQRRRRPMVSVKDSKYYDMLKVRQGPVSY